MAGPITTFGALLSKPAFNRIRSIMDPDDVGAAPLLGVNGLVFIGHGRSNAHALVSAIKVARQAVEADTLNAIKEAL
jgi:phosphate acyltransferase